MEEERKTDRKRKRFAARLKQSKGIICSDIPTHNIVLCNAGQATGLQKDDILKILQDNGLNITQPKFIAEKGDSHSFLLFDSIDNAELFYNTCNGKSKVDAKGPPLYMIFVEKVPTTEIICPDANPKGLVLINDFISNQEAEEFMKLFDWTPESNNLKNRQVKHYGYEFRYGSNDVDLNSPLIEKIPEECGILWKRLEEHGYRIGAPDQLTVNKYCSGQGIPSHVDRHSPFGDTILSLSLGSDVVMDWKHHSGKYVPVLVKANSLLIMQDEARYDWQHGIQPRTWDPVIEHRPSDISGTLVRVLTSDTVPRQTRISLTFRWTRSGQCECKYRTLCDSVEKVSADNLEDGLASNLEELHVHQVYEQIAGHFSTTRHKPWPKVVEFMESVPSGSVVLDLGCGNGKNILKRDDIVQIAGERSSGLLAECKSHVYGVSGADCLRLDLLAPPLRAAVVDVVLCVAVVHHFSSEARRLQAILNIHRLLRSGGRALITVWAKDQTKSNYLLKSKIDASNDTDTERQVTFAGVQLPVHENRTQFKHKDLLVPWKLRKLSHDKLLNTTENTLLRYYHVFEENELDQICKKANFDIEKSFYEEGNWCVVCKKK